MGTGTWMPLWSRGVADRYRVFWRNNNWSICRGQIHPLTSFYYSVNLLCYKWDGEERTTAYKQLSCRQSTTIDHPPIYGNADTEEIQICPLRPKPDRELGLDWWYRRLGIGRPIGTPGKHSACWAPPVPHPERVSRSVNSSAQSPQYIL